MKTRKTSTLFLGTLLALAVSTSATAESMTLKLGHLANEENIWHKASLKFGEELSELTDGRITVEVYPNESLGKEVDLINGMQLGTVDMTISGESLQNWAPMASLIGLPYAYQSLEDMDGVINGEIGQGIEKEIIEKARVRPIAYFARGPRNLTSNRPITSPDELDGLKMRVPNVPLFVDMWKALGANPTPMAFSEVFTSLQNGTIDAQENPLALIKSANFNEVQDFVNLTEHSRSWIYLVLSELTWAKLSADDQAAVMEAASRAQAFEREAFLEDETKLAAELQEKGMTFVEVDKDAFIKQAKEAVLANVKPEVKDVAQNLFDR